MLVEIVGDKIAKIVGDEKNILELRLRIGRPLVLCTADGKRIATYNGMPYIVSQKDVDDVLARATNMSFYSASEEMKRGYVPVQALSHRRGRRRRVGGRQAHKREERGVFGHPYSSSDKGDCGQNRKRRVRRRARKEYAYRFADGVRENNAATRACAHRLEAV